MIERQRYRRTFIIKKCLCVEISNRRNLHFNYNEYILKTILFTLEKVSANNSFNYNVNYIISISLYYIISFQC